jgi:hypothetical protein
VSWGDLDNDGRVDLIAADVGHPAYLYFNKGEGNFTATPFEIREPESIALVDYDRDGLLDLYVTHWPSMVGAVTNAIYHQP